MQKVPPLEGGRWEFDRKLTYQSLYDKIGGLRPVEGIGGDLYVGPRYEFHFDRKYFDFDAKQMVLIGYLDNAQEKTRKVVPINILERTFDYIEISYITHYGDPELVRMFKTPGCYYIKNEDGFNEYYCKAEKET